MFRTSIGIFSLLLIINCASTVQSGLEDAREALNNDQYAAAITSADAVLAVEPNNIEAASIKATAQFAQSGLNFFDIAEALSDDSAFKGDTQNFDVLTTGDNAAAFPSTATISKLQEAIDTLSAVSGITDATLATDELKDAAYKLGIYRALNSFVFGIYNSNFHEKDTGDAMDVSGITSKDAVQSDLINFDNRLLSSGLSESDSADNALIEAVRLTYCILSPLSTGDGFTLGEYQALVACQLSTTAQAATLDTTALAASVATCATLAPANATQACLDADTE